MILKPVPATRTKSSGFKNHASRWCVKLEGWNHRFAFMELGSFFADGKSSSLLTSIWQSDSQTVGLRFSWEQSDWIHNPPEKSEGTWINFSNLLLYLQEFATLVSKSNFQAQLPGTFKMDCGGTWKFFAAEELLQVSPGNDEFHDGSNRCQQVFCWGLFFRPNFLVVALLKDRGFKVAWLWRASSFSTMPATF